MSYPNPNPQSPAFRMAGGSRSEDTQESGSSSVISFFQPGVEWLLPSEKKVGLQIRIKPALDASRAGEPDFKSTWKPYRDRADIDPETGMQRFTNWFMPFRGYRYLGRGGLNFISPITREAGPGVNELDRADPVLNIRNFCKGDPAWKHLTEPPVEKRQGRSYESPALPYPKEFVAYNAWFTHQRQPTPKDAVFVISGGGHDELVKQLKVMRPAEGMDQRLIDPDWSQFMLGDITHPARGLLASVQQVACGPKGGATAWAPLFTRDGTSPTGMTQVSLTQEQFVNRYDITSSETLRIEPYQVLVEILVADGFLPRDLIAAACGNMCSIPGGGLPQPTFQTSVTGFPGAPPPLVDRDNTAIPMQFPQAGGYQPPAAAPVYAPPAGGYQPPAAYPQAAAPPPFGAPAPQQPPMQFPQAGGYQPPAPVHAPLAPPVQPSSFGLPPAGAPAPSMPFGGTTGAPMPSPFGAPAMGHPVHQQPAFQQPVLGAPAQTTVGYPPTSGAAVGWPPAASPPAAAPAQAGYYPQQQAPAPARDVGFMDLPPVVAPPAPPPPAPPPPVVEMVFVYDGVQVLPQPMPLQDVLQRYGPQAQVYQANDPNHTWKPAGSLGAPPAMAPPPPPPAPAFGAPAGVVAAQQSGLLPLGPEELAEYQQLEKRLVTGELNSDAEGIRRIGELNARLQANHQAPPA